MTAEQSLQTPETATSNDALLTVGKTIAKGVLTEAFGKAARFIHGELTQSSLEAVAKMHERFNAQIEQRVTAALPENASESLKKTATDYCIALSRARRDMTQKQLKEKFAGSESDLKEETREMLAPLARLDDELEAAVAKKKNRARAPEIMQGDSFTSAPAKPAGNTIFAMFRGLFNLSGRFKQVSAKVVPPTDVAEPPPPANENRQETFIWGDDQRIYFKLSDSSASPVLPYVEKYLTEKGYKISDYAAGYATDNRKNTLKIGKLLKDDPALLEAYQEDPYRLNSGGLAVVLTRSYEDLARASYARGWQSCRADSYTAVKYGVAEIDLGVIAAYLVREDDPDIHNPLGRINLKPYHRDDNKGPKSDTIYMTFNPIGLHHPGFVDAVNRFAEEHLNGAKYGKFKLPNGCESYREMTERTRIPEDAEGALKALGADYTKDRDGKITVHGDLYMAKLGLSRLPDLREVVVEGGIDVSGNKLLTLEGLPQAPIQWLKASSNLLTCFAGCTPDVGEKFDYRDNAYLITTFGAPKAERYSYGNGQRDSGNYQTSAECIGPLEDKKRFPGFKRKD